MKTAKSIFVLLFMATLIVSGCTPCNECNDPKLTKINRTDTSKPVIQWSYSSGRTGPGAATSSISIVSDPAVGVDANIGPNLTYGVYAEATDPESGIKSIKLSGGFSTICRNAAGLFSAHGQLGEQSQNFNFTNCALKSWNLKDLKIENYANCGSGSALDRGDATYQCITENFAGLKDTSVLVVRFRQAAL